MKCKNCGESEEGHFVGSMLMNIKGCSKFIKEVLKVTNNEVNAREHGEIGCN